MVVPSVYSSILLLFYLSFISITTSETFIINVSKSDKPAIFATHHNWYSSILNSLSSFPNHQSHILYTYKHTVNGFSATLTSEQVAEISRVPGILSVLPDTVRHIHTTQTPNFLGLSDSYGLWPDSEYGEDVIIGVLDTGIWPERHSFSDEGLSPVPSSWKGICEEGPEFPATSCNRKIIGARVFNNGFLHRLKNTTDISADILSARDTDGHGTHTASTAAGSVVSDAGFFEYAKGEARGMATKARIAVYKVCWSSGCHDSDLLAAMDQAIDDGVHVISLSLGTNSDAPEYYEDPIAIGTFGAVKQGIVVSCSGGNSGPDSSTVVNIAPWILTVGASTINREFPADAILGDGRVFSGVSLFSGDGLGETKYPLVNGADCGSEFCFSGELNSSLVTGKIVICNHGGNERVEKGAAVKDAGGMGMIHTNTEENGEELLADAHLIPATMVGQIAGDKIKAYVKSNPSPTATIAFRGTVIGDSTSAPRVASFSSRGPNHLTLEILKPDVIAPGVNILAGWTGYASPTNLDIDPRRVEFNIISGTSMSCPHVSGLAALLRRANPTWTPAAIKSALMTTAYFLDNNGKHINDLATGNASTPFAHGSGHVDPNRALNPGLVYDLEFNDYMAFLCAIGYDSNKISMFVSDPVNCTAQKLGSPGNLNYPSFSVVFENETSVVKYNRVVKNVGSNVHMHAVYKVKVNAPEGVKVSVFPSKLVFCKVNKTARYQITFTSTATLKNVSDGADAIPLSAFGSIVWSDRDHIVRSPIAVAWLQDSSEIQI